MKLYLLYERPWWRPAALGMRTMTDLPVRKVFYFDGAAGARSALLAMYTDGRDVHPWAGLYEPAPAGAPAPEAMLAEVQRQLREIHPDVEEMPSPSGSALMYWGADPYEVGWHFWRRGVNSDEILGLATQPDPALPVYLANEAFSRRQSWVEGALEAAEDAVDRLKRREHIPVARRPTSDRAADVAVRVRLRLHISRRGASSRSCAPTSPPARSRAAAHELGISESTARQHLSGLYRRVGCENAAQAAYRLGASDGRAA